VTEDFEYGEEQAGGPAGEEYAAELPETGDPQVDAALSPLAGLPRQPVSEHVARFEQVHRGLQEALAAVETVETAEGGD
jgi:hypothetical protein